MIIELFRCIRRVDAAFHRGLDPAYSAIIGVGLVIEIIQRVREIIDHHDARLLQASLAIALFALLLLNQLGELTEHVEQRFRRSTHS